MKTKINLSPFFLLLFIFILPQLSSAQEEEYLVDSLDYKENILDSNDVYMAMYDDSLNADGKWEAIKKSDFIKSVGGEEAEDLDENYYENEILYVWRPNITLVEVNWSPYTNGYWLYTHAGWVWISYYSWGWAPYNYGRWWWSPYYGWVWLPGRIWAPNWCIWRHHHNYVGWYPIHPRIRWRDKHRRWRRNHIIVSKPGHWTFIEKKNFTKKIDEKTRLRDLEIAKNSSRLVDNVSKETGVKYNGPNVRTISNETGRKIDPVQLDPVTKKVRDDTKFGNVNEDNRKDEKIRNEDARVKSNETTTPNNKGDTPNRETQKKETPKRETPKKETPKKETPHYETPKQETPTKETPKYDPPKKETPKQQPKYDPPKEKPRNDPPKQERPKSNPSREKSGNNGKTGRR